MNNQNNNSYNNQLVDVFVTIFAVKGTLQIVSLTLLLTLLNAGVVQQDGCKTGLLLLFVLL